MQNGGLRIDVHEAKRKVDSGEAVILDVVAPQVWEQMHEAIPRAIRIDPREIEQRLHELPRDKEIIAYCT